MVKHKLKKQVKRKIGILSLSILILLISLTNIVISDPPEQKNVYGKIYANIGVGAPNGVPVIVNNTNILQEFYTQVYAPPIPALAGSYSLVVNGSTGDTIIIRAYNSSHYGQTITALGTSSTIADVYLNMTRPPEVNLTITSPPNNTIVGILNILDVAVNMTVLINNGLNCNVTLIIENESVINYSLGTNTTNLLGSINIGTYKNTSFELTALQSGNTNIFAQGMCENSQVSYLNLFYDSINNITVQDSNPPVVKLINPQNNAAINNSNQILFQYNVTDESSILNCSLHIDGKLNSTNYTVQKNGVQNFTYYLENGAYNWSVSCYDELNNFNQSIEYSLIVEVHYPVVTFPTTMSTVTLLAGASREVICNVSVEDGNGAADISMLNATIHSVTVSSSDLDDYNNHYTNSSCQQTSSSGNMTNYTCEFSVLYYAMNGTWQCNATAYDYQDLTTSNYTNFTIDTLYALNVSELLINYGTVATGALSMEQILNITNFGNRPLNITAVGYGGNDPISGLGYAMMCSSGYNITVENERYAFNPATAFTSKIPLTATPQDMGATLNKQTIPGILQTNSSYWQLNVSVPQTGQCNGTIRLTAFAP